MPHKVIIGDLEGIAKWVICTDGVHIVDPKYLDEYHQDMRQIKSEEAS